MSHPLVSLSIKETEQPILPGVVVDKIEKNSEAGRVGLREGDVLLSWSQKETQGTFESSFDLPWLNLEQSPFGPISLYGIRKGRTYKWRDASSLWLDYQSTRPNFKSVYLARYKEGKRLVELGRLQEAVRVWQELASHFSIQESSWPKGWLFLRCADILRSTNKWDDADRFFSQAVQAFETLPGAKLAALSGWAWNFHERGDLDSAIDYYENKVLPEAKKIPPRESQIGQSKKIVVDGFFCPRSREDNWAVNPPVNGIPGFTAASILAVLGTLNQEKGDLEKAENYARQAQAAYAPFGVNFAFGLLEMGNISFYRGDLQKAARYYRQVFMTCSAFKITSLNGLAIVADAEGDSVQAERYYHYILPLLKTKDLIMALTLGNLGLAVHNQGRYVEAEHYYREQQAILLKILPRSIYLAACLNHLGNNFSSRGNFPLAQKYLRESLQIRGKSIPNTLEHAYSLNDLGDLMRDAGRLHDAKDLYLQALRIRKELAPGSKYEAEVLASLGNLMRRDRNPDEAEKYYKQAIEALESQLTRFSNSSEVRSDFRAARGNYYREYADILLSRGNKELAYSVLQQLRARTTLELLASAHVNVHNGVDTVVLKKAQHLQADISSKSHRRVRLVGRKHSDEEMKALDNEMGELLDQYLKIEEQIRSTSPAYAALTQPQPLTAKEVQSQLLDSNTLLLEYSLGEDRSYVFAVTPDSLNAYELPKRAEVEKAARHVYSLLTARNAPVKNETSAQKLARLARAETEYPRAATELSKMILGPVAAQLQNKRLLIVTDGALAYIPFATLPEPANKNADTSASIANTAVVEPLIVNHEIVNLPSASVLAVLRQQEQGRKAAPNAVAVLADPVFDRSDPRVISTGKTLTASVHQISAVRSGQTASKRKVPLNKDLLNEGPLLEEPSSSGLLTRSATDIGLTRNGQLQLPRLLFTRKEADEILAVTPAGAGKKAVDFDASRATATSPELSQYRIVHFATHGLLDSAHPELSGLVFSMVDKKGRPQNGFLELQDIYNLNLPADLIVLSACETGLGKEISGEGLVGLTRGFMYAGASRVVASLWRVSDVGTAELMAAFYTSMEKDGLPPAAALRAAQIKLIKQKRWANPYYWAAFQIQGEWK